MDVPNSASTRRSSPAAKTQRSVLPPGVLITVIVGFAWGVGIAGIRRAVRRRNRLVAEITASRDDVRRSRRRLTVIQGDERRRFAALLHDGLQMRVVLLALEAAQVSARLPADVATAAGMDTLRTSIDDLATELRTVVHTVMPAALVERGLVAAVHEQLDRLPLQSDLHADVEGVTFTPDIERVAYFTIVEALTNTVKHAAATRVWVSITLMDDVLRVRVQDDGVGGAVLGAVLSAGDVVGGTGLRAAADRAASLGGTMLVRNRVGGGTLIEVALPCAS